MRLASILTLFVVLLVSNGFTHAQSTLRLDGPESWTDQSQPLVLEVRLDSDTEIETLRLAIGHDPSQVSLDDVSVDIALEPLPTNPFVEIFDLEGGVIAQLILDEPLPPSTDTLIATLTYNAVSATSVQGVVAVQFQDAVYGSPPANNQLVPTSGGIIDAGSGLAYEQYVAGILGLSIDGAEIPVGGTGTATVLMSTDVAVQGYQVAVGHEPTELTLESVDLTGTITESLGADFVTEEVFPEGGTLSVILDLEAPFDGQVIPVGSSHAVGHLTYSCVEHPIGTPPVDYTIAFVDGVLGAFPVYNLVISEEGTTLFPETNAGTMTCLTELLPVDAQYFAGQLDGDTVTTIQAIPGAGVDVGLYYTEPQFGIDAFDISLSFSCELGFVGLSIIGSTLESIGVEFISTDLDKDSGDGDGCEFTAQIIIDELPPFDGQQAPASATPLLLGTLSGSIPAGATMGTSYPVEFIDGLDGSTGTPVDNRVWIQGFDYPANGNASSVDVEQPAGTPFVRGDCNDDGGIDVADAVSFLDIAISGSGGSFVCDGACDTNNDGALDIADAVYSLTFQFSGGPDPAAPFPDCGISIGEECDSFTACP